jgi:hypothetical protein
MKSKITEAGRNLNTFAHRQGIFLFGKADDINTKAASEDDSISIYDFLPEKTTKAEREVKR